jgi:hypothetical protein
MYVNDPPACWRTLGVMMYRRNAQWMDSATS